MKLPAKYLGIPQSHSLQREDEILQERALSQRPVMGTDRPIYVQLVRTHWKPGSCWPRVRPFYEVRRVVGDVVETRRQFASVREAKASYAAQEPS